MRTAWTRSQARVERYREEVELIQEEMRRTLVYHDWVARLWRSRKAVASHLDRQIMAGMQSYAEKQAVVWERLAHSAAIRWSIALKSVNLEARKWPEHYKNLSPRIKVLDADDGLDADDDDEHDDLDGRNMDHDYDLHA
jgi:hypothetical protein